MPKNQKKDATNIVASLVLGYTLISLQVILA